MACRNTPYDLTVLVHGSPQVMLLAIDLYKYFANVKGIAVATVLCLKTACIKRAKLDTPKADGSVGDGDAPLSQKILNIAVT